MRDLVEVEYEIQFTNIAEELVEQLDEEMDGLEVHKLVVRHVLNAIEGSTRIVEWEGTGEGGKMKDARKREDLLRGNRGAGEKSGFG